MSRGIGAEEARGLLVRAFSEEMIEAVSDDGIRRWLEKGLVEWLVSGKKEEKAA